MRRGRPLLAFVGASGSVPSREDDHNWPEPDRVGRQELEVKLGKEHISFTVSRPSITVIFNIFVGPGLA